MGSAVFLVAGFGGFGAELLFFAVGDDADAGGGDAGSDEGGFGGVGSVFAEGEVVLGGAALVAVAADEDADGGVGLEEGGGGVGGVLGVGPEVDGVVVEEDVLDGGVEGLVGDGAAEGLVLVAA